MDAPVFEHSEIRARWQALQELLREQQLDGALILQRADLVYLTGAAFNGALALPSSGEPTLVSWRGGERLAEACPVARIDISSFGRLHEPLAEAGVGQWKRTGLEKDVLPLSMAERLTTKLWPEGESIDISPALRGLRSVKSEAEQELVRQSGSILATGFHALKDILREGVLEYEAQALLDVVLRGAGHQGFVRTRGFNAEPAGVIHCGATGDVISAFDGPIAQPGRSSLVPAGAGEGPVVRDMPVIADHVAGYQGYMSDMTRTYVLGKASARDAEAHSFCVELHRAILRRMLPGAVPSEIWEYALEQARNAGYSEVFMNHGANKVRFLGHGVGLEMDELPILASPFHEPLRAGQVVAVEPKIIFEDGVGVGVEDTVIIGEEGAEVVTPMELEMVELVG